MTLEIDNYGNVVINQQPYAKGSVKAIYSSNTITLRDEYGLIAESIPFADITLDGTPAASMSALKDWVQENIYASIKVDIEQANLTVSNEVEVKNDSGNPIPVRTQEYPAAAAQTITPHDSTNLSSTTRGVYVGVSGDVVAIIGGSPYTFKNVPAGAILPIAATRVNATNTTATNLIALY